MVNLNTQYPVGEELYFIVRTAADPRDEHRVCIYQRNARVRKAEGSYIADLLLSNISCPIDNTRYLTNTIRQKIQSLIQYKIVAPGTLRKLSNPFEPKEKRKESAKARKRKRDMIRHKTRVRITAPQQKVLDLVTEKGHLYTRAGGQYAWWDTRIFHYLNTQVVRCLLRKELLFIDEKGFVRVKKK